MLRVGPAPLVAFNVLVLYGVGIAAPPSQLLSDEAARLEKCEDEVFDRVPQSMRRSLLQRMFNVTENLRPSGDVNPTSDLLETNYSSPAAVESEDIKDEFVLTHESEDESEDQQPMTLSSRGTVKLTKTPVLFYGLPICFIVCAVLVLYCYASDQTPSDLVRHELYSRDEKGKVYAYDNEQLLTWRVLFHAGPSLALSWQVWVVVPCVLGTACVFVLMMMHKVKYASQLDTKKLDEFGTYLRVFIAFMLGLFMNNSFQRWNMCVTNFRQFLTTVKTIAWTLRLMGIRKELTDDIESKCVVACYILEAEMRTDQLGCKSDEWQPHWDNTWKFLVDERLLTQEEEQAIRVEGAGKLNIDVWTYSAVIWAWIGRSIHVVRSEPSVLVPMYVRLVSMSHTCISEIDALKTTIQVQIPFSYAYLLSVIVHVNNIILAVCSGIQIGASLMGMDMDSEDSDVVLAATKHQRTVIKSAEIFAMQTLILLIQPVMYQACLVISHLLNHPFGDHMFHLPTETFILMMREDLRASATGFKDHKHSGEKDAALANDSEREHSSGGSSGGDDDDDEGD